MEKIRKIIMVTIITIILLVNSYTTKISNFNNKTIPKLDIKVKDIIYFCPNGKKIYPKYEAYDSFGNDITNKVIKERIGAYIVYSVTDNYFNKKVIKKPYKYQDVESPILDLSNIVTTIHSDEDIIMDNYEVSDNCDSNPKVKIYSKINKNVPGNYNINYTVNDKYGNTTKESIEITLLEKLENGVIYLTFDDGPRFGTTNIILDILKRNDVKATFFVTNGGSDSLIKREFDEGHSIALHTATHDYSYIYSSIDNYFYDLQSVHDRVYNITGFDSKMIRFPGGSGNTVSRKYSIGIMSNLIKEVEKRGYRYFDWNITSGDAGNYYTSEEIENHVIANISKNKPNIILMHDIKPYTRDALENIINYAKANNYSFKTLTNFTDTITQKVNN